MAQMSCGFAWGPAITVVWQVKSSLGVLHWSWPLVALLGAAGSIVGLVSCL